MVGRNATDVVYVLDDKSVADKKGKKEGGARLAIVYDPSDPNKTKGIFDLNNKSGRIVLGSKGESFARRRTLRGQ